MIHRLEIENFHSILDRQVIDLTIAENAPALANRFVPKMLGSRERVPRVVAFFGPNASGKTNVLRALSFLSHFIADSFTDYKPGQVLPFAHFHSIDGQARATRLAFSASGPARIGYGDGGSDQFEYRYELELIPTAKGPSRYVVGHEILTKQGPRGRAIRVFERVGKEVKWSNDFDLSGFENVVPKVRDNASLISTMAQFDFAPALALRAAALSVFSSDSALNTNDWLRAAAEFYRRNPNALTTLNREIRRLDLGISEMELAETKDGPTLHFFHDGLSGPMHVQAESDGTKRFVIAFPNVFLALAQGGICIIDEIDNAIHPILLPEIVSWFYDPKRNPRGAQLWLSTHADSLLHELEKEEVFFCKKNAGGQTTIYGLSDIKGVRRSDPFARRYLGGAYGAVPGIG